MNAFDLIPGYQTQIALAGREPLVALLVAFLITFALTRLYTRLARVCGWGSGSVGGVHLHHMVVGIILILLSGLVAIAIQPESPGIELLGIIFGIGAALTLDEFALWLYLQDVYWAEEGRTSIVATLVGVLVAGLLLIGTAPFGVDGEAESGLLVAFVMVAVNIALALVTFLKGKLTLGVVSIFVPLVGLVAALRLAKPRSPWARWFYSERKLERAVARFDDGHTTLKSARLRLLDLIGGAPTLMTMSRRIPVPVSLQMPGLRMARAENRRVDEPEGSD